MNQIEEDEDEKVSEIFHFLQRKLEGLDIVICLKILKQLMNFFSKAAPISNDDSIAHAIYFNDQGTQTDEIDQDIKPPWELGNISTQVKTIAEQSVNNTGFIYDRKTGSYYNSTEQCYYFPEFKLYYYIQSNAYYYYDDDEKCLKYHSTVPLSEPKNIDDSSSIPGIEDIEEGEISPVEETEHQCKSVIEAAPTIFDKETQLIRHKNKSYAPCIRLIVKETQIPDLVPGTLFILTCTGGTLGRERPHDIVIPDISVSRFHTKFHCSYHEGNYIYEIVDMGSRNGTFLNGFRLSDSMVKSEPYAVHHGNILQIGSTIILCHIHDDYETCKECDPICNGFVQSNAKEKTAALTSRSLKEQHGYESNQIRKKFGLLEKQLPGMMSKYPQGYEDKSAIRRANVGSSHSSEKTEVSSMCSFINKTSKGFNMLSKMGWKEGQTLGKNNHGLTVPINFTLKTNKRGFDASVDSSAEMNLLSPRKNYISSLTRKRFKQITESENGPPN